MKYSYAIISLFACWQFAASCVKKDDYKKFLKEGEIQYPARPDSITVHPGENRIMLSWELAGDPNLSGYEIFWNNGKDSMRQDITERGEGDDTINVLIDKNVMEGAYTFTIYSFDQYNHQSIPSEITGKTYGNNFQSQLPGNRSISKINNNADSVLIAWTAAATGNIFTELHYITVDGTTKTMRVASDSLMTVLPDYRFSSDILYKSAFLPDSNAIDTFYVPDFDTVRLEK